MSVQRRSGRKSGYWMIVAAAITFAPKVHNARGSTFTWSGLGADNNWLTPANWTSTMAPSGTGANLYFTGSTQLTNANNNPGGTQYASLNFQSGAGPFVLTGSALTVAASSAPVISDASTSLEIIDIPLTVGSGRTIEASAGTLSIAGGLADSNGGIDFGVNPALANQPVANGVIVLNCATNYTTASASTADTVIFSGTLEIGAGGSLPTGDAAGSANGWVALGAAPNATTDEPSAAGFLILGDATTPINQTISFLRVNANSTAGSAVYGGNSAVSTLTINDLQTATDNYGGNLGGSGTNQNNLALVITGGNTVNFSGTNSYTGGTTIGFGTLMTGSNSAIPTGSSVTFGDGTTDNATLDLDGNTATVGKLSVNGSGTYTIGNSSLTVPGTLVFNSAGSSTFGGVIKDAVNGGSQTSALTVNGGSLTLTNANTYSGATTVNGGVLLAGASNSLSHNSSIDVAGGTLDVSGSTQTIPSLTVGASGTLNLGIGNLLTDIGAASFGGTLNVSGTPSGPTVELMSYTSDSGTFATIPTFAGYNLVYGATELELVVNAGPVNLTWNNAGGATPSDGQTWDSSNNKNWNNTSSPNTVYTDGAGVTFNDANNYPTNPNAYNVTLNTLVSPGSVTVNNSAANYTISGTGTIGGTGSLTKSGTATLTLSTPNTYSGGTTVNAGKLLIGQAVTNATFSGPTLVTANTLTALPTGALSISGNGIAQLADGVTNQTFVTPNAHSALVTSNINLTSLSITGNGTLDIGNNRIIIDYSSPATDPIASIAAWIHNGYSDNDAPGAGPSIISSDIAADDAASGFSYGIGYADGADNVVAGLPSGEIEIMFTLLGDANLDGIVNSEDFTPFSQNVGQSGKAWDDGDFNYDGTVNAEDFTPFSHDLGQPAALAASELGALNSPLEVSNGISLANVPEPASMGLLTLGVVGVLARRRRI